MEKRNGLYNIHDLDPTGCEISVRANFDFLNKVAGNSALREKLAKAESITGNQTVVTAMLFGRNDGSKKDLASEKALQMQEKIMAERKRMVS